MGERFCFLECVFVCGSVDGEAVGRGRLEGLHAFCVLAGSTAKGDPNRITQARMVKHGVLRQDGNRARFVFPKDYCFGTPSAAASTILGREANGWQEWKTQDGAPLDQFGPHVTR